MNRETKAIIDLSSALMLRKTHRACPHCDTDIKDSDSHAVDCRFYKIELMAEEVVEAAGDRT